MAGLSRGQLSPRQALVSPDGDRRDIVPRLSHAVLQTGLLGLQGGEGLREVSQCRALLLVLLVRGGQLQREAVRQLLQILLLAESVTSTTFNLKTPEKCNSNLTYRYLDWFCNSF